VFVPRQGNSYDCGVFVCLSPAQKPFTFEQADIDEIRLWMVHLWDKEGRKQKGAKRQERSETQSDFDGLGYQSPKTERQARHAS
jgi:hypothetical protein